MFQLDDRRDAFNSARSADKERFLPAISLKRQRVSRADLPVNQFRMLRQLFRRAGDKVKGGRLGIIRT